MARNIQMLRVVGWRRRRLIRRHLEAEKEQVRISIRGCKLMHRKRELIQLQMLLKKGVDPFI